MIGQLVAALSDLADEGVSIMLDHLLDDLQATIDELERMGEALKEAPAPKPGAEGARILVERSIQTAFYEAARQSLGAAADGLLQAVYATAARRSRIEHMTAEVETKRKAALAELDKQNGVGERIRAAMPEPINGKRGGRGQLH